MKKDVRAWTGLGMGVMAQVLKVKSDHSTEFALSKDLHRDLLRYLPTRFDLANRSPVAYHDSSTMNIVCIQPTGVSANIPTSTPFVAASKQPPPQHESGFYHWYDHFRKRRKLARLGQHAQIELTNDAATTRYAAIRRRQLETGLQPSTPSEKTGPFWAIKISSPCS